MGGTFLSGGMSNFSSLVHSGTNMLNFNTNKKRELDEAKWHYDQRVEHSHQRLNDAVEYANRTFEDTLRNLERR